MALRPRTPEFDISEEELSWEPSEVAAPAGATDDSLSGVAGAEEPTRPMLARPRRHPLKPRSLAAVALSAAAVCLAVGGVAIGGWLGGDSAQVTDEPRRPTRPEPKTGEGEVLLALATSRTDTRPAEREGTAPRSAREAVRARRAKRPAASHAGKHAHARTERRRRPRRIEPASASPGPAPSSPVPAAPPASAQVALPSPQPPPAPSPGVARTPEPAPRPANEFGFER